MTCPTYNSVPRIVCVKGFARFSRPALSCVNKHHLYYRMFMECRGADAANQKTCRAHTFTLTMGGLEEGLFSEQQKIKHIHAAHSINTLAVAAATAGSESGKVVRALSRALPRNAKINRAKIRRTDLHPASGDRASNQPTTPQKKRSTLLFLGYKMPPVCVYDVPHDFCSTIFCSARPRISNSPGNTLKGRLAIF